MRLVYFLISLSLLFSSQIGFTLAHVRRGPTSHRLHTRQASRTVPKATTQRQMDPQRASQIQAALSRSGYLAGDSSGRWDSDTEAAMRRYQAANGWQTKLTPDSRAIIKLGLGPSDPLPLHEAGSPTESQ